MSSNTSSKPRRLPGKFGPAIDFSKVPAISKLGKQNRSKWYIPHEPPGGEEARLWGVQTVRDVIERAIDEGYLDDSPID